ncbi:MAG: chromate transporter [Spirochaetales bacterium]|jgi:chromate transporter|nr:chromate transporter [Spirochaetales bacterium]
MARPETVKARDLLTMFVSFFKIGAFTIGGGYAMLPLIEREFVDVRGWVTQEEIVDVFAVAQSLPGVIAINTSICIGYKIGGIRGSLMAAAGMIIPSFVSILLIAVFLVNMQNNQWIQKAFSGVRAGVTAMILLAAIKLGKSVLRNPPAWVLGALSFLALVVFDINAILVILASALSGFVIYGILKAKKL